VATAPPNKGMKQTSVERIGRSQLIPGVGRTYRRSGGCQQQGSSDSPTYTRTPSFSRWRTAA
jgi:hypothetical protein